MTLPKINAPIYETVLPSGTRVQYRPFLVKEEKLFFMASQSDDTEVILSSVKQILANCLISGPEIDNFPIFDIEYLLLQIRARSVSEKVNLTYKCNEIIKQDDGKEKICGVKSEYEINLVDFAPTTFPDHTKTIMLTNTVGVVMQYPVFSKFSSALIRKFTENEIIDILIDCIEKIFDENTVHLTKDVSKKEVIEFIESLSSQQLKKLDRFFETLPKNLLTINFNCPACHYQETVEVSGIENFFV